MRLSTDRFLTTHTGSLARPKSLVDLVLDAIVPKLFEAETAKAVVRQIEAGVDVISDGEMSKPSYTTYIRHRISGIEPDPRAVEKGRDIMTDRDVLEHPDFAQERGNFTNHAFPGCVGALPGHSRAREAGPPEPCCESRPRSRRFLFDLIDGGGGRAGLSNNRKQGDC